MQLGHAFRADGRWRLYGFAAAEDPAKVVPPREPLPIPERGAGLPGHTPEGADIDSVIDVLAILQQSHRELALAMQPTFLLPRKGRYGLVDYEKLFYPDLKNRDLRGIDRSARLNRYRAARPVRCACAAARRLP